MVLSLKTWKSRSLPGLPRTESSLRYHHCYPTNACFAIARPGGVAHHKLAKRTHLFPKYKRTRPEKPRGQPLRLFFYCLAVVRWFLRGSWVGLRSSMPSSDEAENQDINPGATNRHNGRSASDSFSVNRRERRRRRHSAQRGTKSPGLGGTGWPGQVVGRNGNELNTERSRSM